MSASASIAAVSALLEITNVALQAGSVLAEANIRAQQIAALLHKVQAEKRDITAEEWAALDADLEAAKARAHAAL